MSLFEQENQNRRTEKQADTTNMNENINVNVNVNDVIKNKNNNNNNDNKTETQNNNGNKMLVLDFDHTLSCHSVCGDRDFDKIDWLFGSEARIQLLQQFLTLIKKNHIKIVIVSTSFRQVIEAALTKINLLQYIDEIYDRPTIDPDQKHNYIQEKCDTIKELCQKYNINFQNCIFIDNDKEYLEKACCKTMWVQDNAGMTPQQMMDICKSFNVDCSLLAQSL